MMNVALNTLYTAEPLLMVVAMVTLFRSREHRRFPALFAYVSVRLTSTVILHLLMHAHRFITVSEKAVYSCYFYTYWCSYVASAIVVFLVIQELFQSSMDPFPGLKWLGTVSFRWVACISFVATSAALLTPGGKGNRFVLALVGQAMRCESVFILSLLLFLMLAAGKLGLSYRSRVFGISFGFGIMAASDLIVSAAFLHFGDNMLTSTVSVVTTSASLVTLAVWSAYLLIPEPARRVAAFSPSSPLARWNEIATTLGHSAPRVPVAVPASDFFLQDVEKVVDRILIKNSLHVAS